MNLSKRTLILTAIAILCVIVAVLSVYMEKRELEKIIDGENPEEEPDEIPEVQVFKKQPTRSTTEKSKKEPEKQIDNESETVTN